MKMADNLENLIGEYDKILDTIKIITSRAHGFEISCFTRGDKSVIDTKYFKKEDIKNAVQWVMSNNGKREVYVNINRIEEDYVQERHSRISDNDIDKRLWLLIDLDAEGGKKTNPPQSNIDMAGAIAEQIKEDMASLYLWPDPLIASTGNGFHMLYPITCRADNNTDSIIQRVTEQIAISYAVTGLVKIDKLYDRSRIVRLYGTRNIKHLGEAKTSEIISYPSFDRFLSHKDLENFISTSHVNTNNVVAQNDFDMDGFIKQFVPDAKKTIRANRELWAVPCPNNPDHIKDSRPQVIKFTDKGNYGFKCHHDSCKTITVYDFIKKYDPASVTRLKKSNKISGSYDTKVINGYKTAIEDLVSNGRIGQIKYDEFQDKVTIDGFHGRDLDTIAFEVMLILNESIEDCKFTSQIWTKESIKMVAFHNRYDSAQEWADNLVWDETPRLETMFIDYLGAMDDELSREAARWFMVMVAKRIYEPGSPMDKCIMLVGPQGVGKSKLFKFLCPQYYQEYVNRPDDVRDLAAVTMGNLILELPEGSALEKLSEERKKAFITTTEDTFRKLYSSEKQSVPRRYGIVLTTNNYKSMRDSTGNRRYIPIIVPSSENPAEKVVAERLERAKQNGEQIWAEAIWHAKALIARNMDLAVPEYFDMSETAKGMTKTTLIKSRAILDNPVFHLIKELVSMHPDITMEDFYQDDVLTYSLIWHDRDYEYVTGSHNLIEVWNLRKNTATQRLIRDCMEALHFNYLGNVKARSVSHPIIKSNTCITVFRREISIDRGLGWLPDDVLDNEFDI